MPASASRKKTNNLFFCESLLHRPISFQTVWDSKVLCGCLLGAGHAQLSYLHAFLGLFEEANDLLLAVSALSHLVILLELALFGKMTSTLGRG
jgi:hypothetical protein